MKQALKAAAEGIAFLLILPTWLLYCLERLVLGKDAACQAISQRAARWPGRFGEYLRRALMRRVLGHVGKGVVISFGTVFSKADAELGDWVYLGAYCVLGDIRVGNCSMIGEHSAIPSGKRQHGIERTDVPMRDQEGIFQTVRIGEDCWIGSNNVVLADVGSHCVVGAGSLINKPVEDYAVMVGNPARKIADRRDLEKKPDAQDRKADGDSA